MLIIVWTCTFFCLLLFFLIFFFLSCLSINIISLLIHLFFFSVIFSHNFGLLLFFSDNFFLFSFSSNSFVLFLTIAFIFLSLHTFNFLYFCFIYHFQFFFLSSTWKVSLILSIFISHYSFLCFQLLSIHKSSGFKTFTFFSWFSFAAYTFKKSFPLSLNPFSFLFIIYSLFSNFFVFLSCTLSLSTYDSIAIVIKCDSLFLLLNFLPQIFTILPPPTFDKWEFSSTNHNTVTCQSVGWLEGWLNWERIT